MDTENAELDLSHWFSTYGLITAERILGTYNIKIPQTELMISVKNKQSFFHKILEIPLHNVLNGIIFQQANDYHIYVQKLFIDYLLSGENAKPDEGLGASVREDLENERQALVILGQEFNDKQIEHNNLIATTQNRLMAITNEWLISINTASKALSSKVQNYSSKKGRLDLERALIHAFATTDSMKIHSTDDFVQAMNDVLALTLDESLIKNIKTGLADFSVNIKNFHSEYEPFVEQVKTIGMEARAYRTQFYEVVLRVTELLRALPEYRIDPVQDAINREPLYFDNTIGEL